MRVSVRETGQILRLPPVLFEEFLPSIEGVVWENPQRDDRPPLRSNIGNGVHRMFTCGTWRESDKTSVIAKKVLISAWGHREPSDFCVNRMARDLSDLTQSILLVIHHPRDLRRIHAGVVQEE